MSWLAQLFRRRRFYDDLSVEIQEHIDERVDHLVACGMSRPDAFAKARRQFGNVTLVQQDGRAVWRWNLLENLLIDARYALRSLRKSPGFAAVVILTLALGIGANTAIFSVVNAVLLRPLPFPGASRLVDLCARSAVFDFDHLGVSLPDIADVRASATALDAVSPYQFVSKEIAGDGQPERVDGVEVSENFFALLELPPLYGRTFTAADMQPDARSVVLSYALWRERFGGNPAAIGKTIRLDSEPYTVIGVMPEFSKIDFATDGRLWTAFVPTPQQLAARKNHSVSVMARLASNATLGQAQQQLDTIAARLAATYPNTDKGWSFRVRSLKPYLLGDARTPLLVLFSAVCFVLLIACANVSNLFLSRGWARRREFAIRSAIGATRGALMRQLGVESVLVALIGGACALLIAIWTLHALRPILPPDIPRIQDVRISSTVAWFTLAAALLAALLSGIAPAILSLRQDVNAAIKEGGAGGSAGKGHNALRQLLVSGEVALAVALLIGATLAIQSFASMLRVNPGFRTDHLVTMRIDFPRYRFEKVEQSIAFVQQVVDGTRGAVGVEAASAGLVFPLGDFVGETTFDTEQSASKEKEDKDEQHMARGNSVTPDFFRVFGIPLMAGRDFNADDRAGKSLVFIVNEALALRVFGTVDVIGKRFATRREANRPVWGEIVGVVGNVRDLDPGAEPKLEVYAPFSQAREVEGVFLAVRTQPDPLAVVAAVEDRIWAIDKDRPVTEVKTIEMAIDEHNATPRAESLLLGAFGGLGFALALVGVYGVMSYLVSQQTREIGIRMALGADPGRVLRRVLVHGLKLTLAGVAIGVAASLGLMRFMQSLLFGVSASDPATFAGVGLLLTLVALAACWVPARRAMRVDPMVALRCE